MQAPSLPVTVTVLRVVLATNCFVVSVPDCPGSSGTIWLASMMPSLSSSTARSLTVVVPVLVILYVNSTSAPPAGRAVWHSPVVPPPPQVSVPSVGSFRPTNVQSGDGAPLNPVVLSGLDESRHIGSQTARFVSGVALHEQLVWRTSTTPLMVTVVLAPRLFPCAVASMVNPFSLACERTSPLVRLGRSYVTEAPDDPVTVTVVAPLIVAPVYFNVSAIAPPVQPAAGGGAGAAHAVFSTSSEQHTTT